MSMKAELGSWVKSRSPGILEYVKLIIELKMSCDINVIHETDINILSWEIKIL